MCRKSGTFKYDEVVEHRRQCGYGPGNNENGPDSHILGRIRELVVAKKLKLPWDPETFYRRGTKDVGGMVEVRGTNKKKGDLFLKPFNPKLKNRAGDEGKGPVVLVEKINRNTYCLMGWIDCDAALAPGRYPRVGGEGTGIDLGIWVPQKDLDPMEWLVEWIEARRQKS
jgi:hypothetical protein